MQSILVRMLSTGRTGTKFLAEVFADQGYLAYHENLKIGEPSSAIMLYVHMLGDLWAQDKEKYYAFESNFAVPYVQAVAEIMKSADRPAQRSILGKLFTSSETSGLPKVVVHTGHILTTATPLVEREISKKSIESKNLILLRNPLMTIHALYVVEGGLVAGGRPYRMRPASFSGDPSHIGAANVWANTYRLADDQRLRLNSSSFRVLELDAFSGNPEYAAGIFDFIGIPFHMQKFVEFSQRELNKPLRATKEDSARNSHIFNNPDLILSGDQVGEIYTQIKDVIDIYQLDWDRCVSEYIDFHAREKSRLGFR